MQSWRPVRYFKVVIIERKAILHNDILNKGNISPANSSRCSGFLVLSKLVQQHTQLVTNEVLHVQNTFPREEGIQGTPSDLVQTIG